MDFYRFVLYLPFKQQNRDLYDISRRDSVFVSSMSRHAVVKEGIYSFYAHLLILWRHYGHTLCVSLTLRYADVAMCNISYMFFYFWKMSALETFNVFHVPAYD